MNEGSLESIPVKTHAGVSSPHTKDPMAETPLTFPYQVPLGVKMTLTLCCTGARRQSAGSVVTFGLNNVKCSAIRWWIHVIVEGERPAGSARIFPCSFHIVPSTPAPSNTRYTVGWAGE